MLISSLNESYDLLSCLKEFNDTCEVIFLKRHLVTIIDSCQDFLKTPDSIHADNFNEFLKLINQIRAEIKLAYIILTEKPIRLDSDILKAQQSLDALLSDISEIQEYKSAIVKSKEDIDNIISALSLSQKEIEKNKSDLEKLLDTYIAHSESIEETNENVSNWTEAITKCKTDIDTYSEKLHEIKNTIETFSKTISSQQLDIEKKLKSTEQIDLVIRKQQEEIKETLAGANKHGMAGSFLTRKEELRKSLRFWQWATICAIIALIIGSFCIVKPILENPSSFSLTSYLSRLPILIALVWLGWFCSKQYGYTARIREDYAYKYAVSMAFEGYKKQAATINKDLLNDLLRITVENIGVNPLCIYDTKNNHGSPINETVDKVCEKVVEPLVKNLKPEQKTT
ncbi:MAG: hypothetical protein LUF87_04680 [Alistipes sp.]|nr:hypothetical protein [Alistipes sp.]